MNEIGVAREGDEAGFDGQVPAVNGRPSMARPSPSRKDQTSQKGDGSGWVPAAACTLPTAEQPLRVAEFANLFTAALRGVDRPAPTRLRLTIDAAARHRAQNLAERETSCCSFFAFTFTPTEDGTVWMDIDVPVARVDVLDGLAAQATQAIRAGVGR